MLLLNCFKSLPTLNVWKAVVKSKQITVCNCVCVRMCLQIIFEICYAYISEI